MIHFGEVMIFGRQPKDGHVGTAGGGGVFRLANHGRCFEESEERTTEERHLLPGNHCAGTVAQPRDVLEDPVSRCKISVLPLEQIAESCTMGGCKNGRRGHPLGGIGTGRKKRRERFMTLGEVQKQPARTRQNLDGITLGLHSRAFSIAMPTLFCFPSF